MAEENTATAIDVRFLMAIVSQLSGQPDWQKVADDCGIVTKGAASKRFSRLKQKFDISSSYAGEDGAAVDGSEKTPKKKAAKKVSPKKRKLEDGKAVAAGEDDPVKEEAED